MSKDKDSDPELNARTLTNIYTAEVFGKFEGKVAARLHSPAMVEAMLVVGRRYQQTALIGEEKFTLLSAVVKSEEVFLRLKPIVREPYMFIEVSERQAAELFRYQLRIRPGQLRLPELFDHDYEQMKEALMMQRDDVLGQTYRAMIDGAIAIEHQKFMKEQIEAHDQFGTW